MERWRNIEGLDGMYEVSDQGRVRSVGRKVPHARYGTMTLQDRVLSLKTVIRRGKPSHVQVSLTIFGKKRTVVVHRAVLEAFVGPCPDGYECCHNDGDPTNNSLSNLRWDTHKGNHSDKRDHGTNTTRKVVRSDGVEFNSIIEAAEETGCYGTNISKVCNGKLKSTGSYGWRYA